MAVELVMPRLSDSMAEGTIVSWLVPDGSPVAHGQAIAEIETDKATLPYEAPEAGILRIIAPEGATLALGDTIGLIDDLQPLPGGQSVAPPGGAGAEPAAGVVPAPRAPDEEPATGSYAIQDDHHGAHTVHASQPPPEAQPEIAWSPAWGPQPTAHSQQGAAAELDDEEEETTEFAAVDVPQDVRATAEAQAAALRAQRPVPSGPDEDGRMEAAALLGPKPLPPRPPELKPATTPQARISASPVARRLAVELGIELASVSGSGPDGRIVRADIEAARASGAARPPKQAAATPSVASDFTPPADEERAQTPIPEVEPEPPVAPLPPVKPFNIVNPWQVDPPAAEPEPEIDPSVAEEAAPVEQADDHAPAEEAPEVPAYEAVVPGPEPHDTGVRLPEPGPDAELFDARDPAGDAEVAPAVEPPASGAELPVEVEPALETAPDSPPGTEPDAAAPVAEREQRVMLAAQPGGGKGEPTVVELSRQQQTVARRMAESKATIPDFHTSIEIDAGPLLVLRADLVANRPELSPPSLNDLLVKAVAVALQRFPRYNGGYRDGRIELYPRINIGIAVDHEGVLLVPVIQDADKLSVSQIAARTHELVGKARDGSLRPPDIASATFTLSNLGMLDVEDFTAVITPGQTGILTVGAVELRPVVKDGQIVPGHTVRLTLTTDHRAIYGAEAAGFLARVRTLLEHPTMLLA